MRRGLRAILVTLFIGGTIDGFPAQSEEPPPLRFRPSVGNLADTIPFFWKGEYHIFYLHGDIGKVPWEHIVSTDLLRWKELPTALVSDGDPDGPDGEHMFTGSVIEHDGTFHILYTGWNPRNKEGREWVMHATSPDLIQWTKHPEHKFRADGEHYQNTDFRDPYVFWDRDEKQFRMILCARDAKTGTPVQGVAQSKDLIHWNQVEPLELDPPLGKGTPECPDIFKIGDTYYLIHSPSAGTTDMRYSKSLRGPYKSPTTTAIDTPILYAAKRMFDGNRHILTGWLRDLDGAKDDGGFRWGGDQSIPREVYPGPNGQLYFRPVSEVLGQYSKSLLDVESTDPTGNAPYDTPRDYLLDCFIDMKGASEVSVVLRAAGEGDAGYRLTLRPGKQEAAIRGTNFEYARPVTFETGKPIHVRAFVEGSLIECFINEAYPFSCRAYEHPDGKLAFEMIGGAAKVNKLAIRTR
ncbi:MAG: family 43 glycosylhydrolase [Candidatus Omnitrophica bacterium]|nr:family 43 glycosylhydrolase [Candidatus Omnitrophota bacterium]